MCLRSERNAMRKLCLILAGCILLAGCTLLLYPSVSQWLEERRQSEVCADYSETADNMDDSAMEQELGRARQYNRDLSDSVAVSDPFRNAGGINTTDYDALLRTSTDGVMAYVEIPKIGVSLPVYHGVSSAVLNKGVGHLPETSLPVGGKSTHAVLAGHSGMSHARLFTDLPKLKAGDVFVIHVYNKAMTYRVDQVKTVWPWDTRDLTIVEGKDYVTLITCTPVGVNSHRLLVRGSRVNSTESTARNS